MKETYPDSPPVWFSENEDSFIADILEKLASTVNEENKVNIGLFYHYSNLTNWINCTKLKDNKPSEDLNQRVLRI